MSKGEQLVTDGGQGCQPKPRPEIAQDRFGLTTIHALRLCGCASAGGGAKAGDRVGFAAGESANMADAGWSVRGASLWR